MSLLRHHQADRDLLDIWRSATDARMDVKSSFAATPERLGDRTIRFVPRLRGTAISRSRNVALLRDDPTYRQWMSDVLRDVPFAAYRWETPSLCTDTTTEPFEFVVIDTPSFTRRATDSRSFSEHVAGRDDAVVVVDNLGGDATLVIPTAQVDDDVYGHLASFLRGAPATQVDALWQAVARVAAERLGDRPVWLSTHGGGVAWLHVRLDDRPKFYTHRPYM